MIENISKYLEKYNQNHLLNFYNDLKENEKDILIKDINQCNLEQMNHLYINSYKDDILDINNISPLTIINKFNGEEERKIAENLIRNNKYGIVLMAGGSASRLGLNKPKGCLELNIKNKKISIFEIFINQLKNIYSNYHIYINLYIMTNAEYDEEIKEFFKNHNYFNYDSNYIHFFKQHNLPILDVNGKILLKNKYSILKGPNGNGDVFVALKENNLIDHMIKNKIEYVLFSTTDNILTNLIDFNFIGTTIKNNYNVSTKTLTKENETEKDWIFCKYNNKPFMLPSAYINEKITNEKLNNNYIYREKNITYHLIKIDSIIKYSNIDLKYHRAYKKNNYCDNNGNIVIANSNNSFKFEKFIFDAFEYDNDMLLYRVNKVEFLPIKTQEDLKLAEKYLNN